MRVRMCLFPRYVSFESARRYSPKFFRWLKDQGVEIEPTWYSDDSLNHTIRNDEPSIVRASSVMESSLERLAAYCNEHGHLLFYNDVHLNNNPQLNPMNVGSAEEFAVLVTAAEKFLRTRQRTA